MTNIFRERFCTRDDYHCWTRFFFNLHEDDQQAVNDLNKDQKIEIILKKLILSLFFSDSSNIQKLHELLQEENVFQSVLNLDKTNCSTFKKILFLDWVKLARDSHELIKLVNDFLNWRGSLQNIVKNRLKDNSDEMKKYVQIKTVNVFVMIEIIQLI